MRPFSRRQPRKLKLLLARCRLGVDLAGILLAASHQRFVFRFCTCTCLPVATSAITLPMSSPYLMTVSPFFSGFSATLWPIGMLSLASSLRVLSVSVMTPSISVPALKFSTTMTPTLSLGLWTRKWGEGTLFPLSLDFRRCFVAMRPPLDLYKTTWCGNRCFPYEPLRPAGRPPALRQGPRAARRTHPVRRLEARPAHSQ